MRFETLAEQLFFTTALVSGEAQNRSWTGTGFVHAVEVEQGTLHVLITNKHVLANADRVTVRMSRARTDGKPWLGASTQITLHEFVPEAWTGHPRPDVDVAALPLGAVFTKMQEIDAPPFFRSIPPELFLDDAAMESIDALVPVTFIGYPSGLFDGANFLPIARRGWTATPLDVEYNGLPAFLIDASVFPGSSGSPVFLLEMGVIAQRAGSTQIGSRIVFLGVLAAVHSRQVEGSLVNLPTALGVTVPELLDLGIVFNARAVSEAIDQLLESQGLTRVEGTLTVAEGEVTVADVAVGEASPVEAEAPSDS